MHSDRYWTDLCGRIKKRTFQYYYSPPWPTDFILKCKAGVDKKNNSLLGFPEFYLSIQRENRLFFRILLLINLGRLKIGQNGRKLEK